MLMYLEGVDKSIMRGQRKTMEDRVLGSPVPGL